MKHKPYSIKPLAGGTQQMFRFDNGYGASVVNHDYSYGQELAVVVFTGPDAWELTYETPVTGDVVGYLADEDLDILLDDISALPALGEKSSQEDDLALAPDELQSKYGDEHPVFVQSEWRYSVEQEATLLGYWPWVMVKVEEEA